jgi:hypothetical protein
MNLVTPKAGDKHGLLFNKPASGVKHSPGKNGGKKLAGNFNFVFSWFSLRRLDDVVAHDDGRRGLQQNRR